MVGKVLITGSSGLVGSVLRHTLESKGIEVVGFDLRAAGREHGDVCDASSLYHAISTCDGVIHLAAVSRVIWGEEDPARCKQVNLGGLRNVLTHAKDSTNDPWVVFASSREVYGQPQTLPTSENEPLAPVNVYGHTKVEGENLVQSARACGLKASVIRLSNVFGRRSDHHDRVVPAFARQAVAGETLRVDGASHTFDFTYVDDVADGIATLVDLMGSKEGAPPPIHFVSGVPTTLGQLANMAIELAESHARVQLSAPRNFDVAQFYGNPSRAIQILGWRAETSVREGLERLIDAYRNEQTLNKIEEQA
ncbi:NAD(P)-dependent oxidoreductase [Microvenator marinus]|uniref:NAD(P)-dependent oxidoreductase n=1 Tax=Microvenator marinus TaxID=2600177 RepID=A0A5B8Y0T5_9DELT|nr:NAD(P)-dependent oxidoreductase [Microvenator marinus]QED29953.1 NAD(P)-dependent oxidoreductase [Microvenator marinus]